MRECERERERETERETEEVKPAVHEAPKHQSSGCQENEKVDFSGLSGKKCLQDAFAENKKHITLFSSLRRFSCFFDC